VAERAKLVEALRTETVGGLLLMAATVIALVWANSPWRHEYEHLTQLSLGPGALHLDLTVEQWANDGLLAVFFFVAGVELKRELTVGELRDPAAAALPVAAALSGVLLPIGVFFAIAGGQPGAEHAWGIPTSTDIAFALAVLAVINTHLPSSLRAFLLTLAVIDDLIAIVIIAVFYSSTIKPLSLIAAIALLAVYYLLQRFRVKGWWLYLPLAAVIWVMVHDSGIHATAAGVAMGLLMRVTPDEGEHESPGERAEHLARPVSAGLAVPLFALTAAGITVGGESLRQAVTSRVPLAVIAAMLVGKSVGVVGGAYLTARLTRAELSEDLAWSDLFGVAVLAGVGFTVSLLISSLAFAPESADGNAAKTAVLIGSLLAAALAAALLRRRNRYYRELEFAEGGG
jgi:Na+:H+ antiporter, NhaA family